MTFCPQVRVIFSEKYLVFCIVYPGFVLSREKSYKITRFIQTKSENTNSCLRC